MNVNGQEQKEGLPPPLPPHHASTAAPHLDGAFTRKLDPAEQERMNAMLGNISKQASQFITNQTNVTATLPPYTDTTTTSPDGALDLKQIPTLYFKRCTGCHYTVDHRTTKVLIEDCTNSTFTFNNTILTSTLEAWKCRDVSVTSAHQIKTMQLDLSHNFIFTLPSISEFGTIVWNSVEQLSLRFSSTPQHDAITGFAHMLPQHPDSQINTDQFIIRHINDALQHERCIRLNNGFLSTEREAIEWDKRAEITKERFVQQWIKDSGITIKRKQEKAIPPNDPCPCQSGKKYKKCCFNKKVLSGVDGEIKADVYAQTAKK